ncbi:unnamed protein product [Citrullus colocynthis]|uniref:Secreted protein n=1 Tax=Citrullus colocynthis TaxID=252529 RepID=A0ABP0ZBR5_9ROSI
MLFVSASTRSFLLIFLPLPLLSFKLSSSSSSLSLNFFDRISLFVQSSVHAVPPFPWSYVSGLKALMCKT